MTKLFFLLLLTSIHHQVFCGCLQTYATVCETLSDYESLKTSSSSQVIIKSSSLKKPPNKPVNLADFRRSTSLTIVGQISELIPERFCYRESLLKFINLYENDIKNLRVKVFPRISNIIILNLRKNNIETIETGTFTLCQPETIDLSNNNIEVIESQTFTYQNFEQKIKTIKMKFNKLVTIEPETFPSSLETLNLHHNSLSFIEPDVFKNLSRLSFLDLSKNKFSMIPTLTFLTNLITLNLSQNRISRISRNTFKSQENIDSIDLSQNKISQIHKDTFMDLKNLQILDLSYNNIHKLEFLTPIRENSIKVSLAFNRLQDMDLGTTQDLPSFSLILYGNPWRCSRWISIEKDLKNKTIQWDACDQKLFNSGKVPFCLCYEPTECYLFPRHSATYHDPFEEFFVRDFITVAKKSHLGECDLRLQKDMLNRVSEINICE